MNRGRRRGRRAHDDLLLRIALRHRDLRRCPQPQRIHRWVIAGALVFLLILGAVVSRGRAVRPGRDRPSLRPGGVPPGQARRELRGLRLGRPQKRAHQGDRGARAERARLKFNLATQGRRQAGSAVKPFVLATAMRQRIDPLSTFFGPPVLTISELFCLNRDGPWNVHNFADEAAGTMNLFQATAHSVNTVFAQLVVAVGPRSVVATAHRMGITSPLLPVCSITLGTQAVSPLEMTAAYATLAARGMHHPPQSLAEVRGPRGRKLRVSSTRGTRALSPNDADIVTQALRGVVESGTGRAAALGRPVAGKTGTAEEYRDAWFCGYVPQLVTCVWVGYPHAEVPLLNIEGFPQVFGGTLPARIWRAFMAPAVARLPVRGFPTPSYSGHDRIPNRAHDGRSRA